MWLYTVPSCKSNTKSLDLAIIITTKIVKTFFNCKRHGFACVAKYNYQISLYVPFSLKVLMLSMVSTQTSSHHCKSLSSPNTSTSSLAPSRDVHLDCNFFLAAIRLASLNQILDPWVYLLLREILLRKFCMVANAVSNCSLEEQKEQQTALQDALNKPNPDANGLQKPEAE